MATTSSVSEANEAGVNLAAMSTDSSSQRSTASSHSSGLPESGEEAALGYAARVKNYSKQDIRKSHYPGENFVKLAEYLASPDWDDTPDTPMDLDQESATAYRRKNRDFGAYYQLGECGSRRFRVLGTPEELESAERERDITIPDDDSSVQDETSDRKEGRLLFLRGSASPKWLNYIGDTYTVNPEFFNRHRDFALGEQDYLPLPSLPSANPNMLRLHVTTVGTRNATGKNTDLSQDELDAARAETHDSMKEYLARLCRNRNFKLQLGDSIVRDFSIHDKEHFSMEQYISINITKAPQGWIAIIWLDVGNDLNDSPAGPWSAKSTDTQSPRMEPFPTIQSLPDAAVALERVNQRASSNRPEFEGNIPQSASLLHLDYGQMLNPRIMAEDPFYALHDVIRFVAFTKVQLFNLIRSTIRREVDCPVLARNEGLTFSNMIFNKQLLQRQIRYIHEILTFIESRKDSHWRRTTDKTAEVAICNLVSDFENLLADAHALVVECDHGSVIIGNAMAIEAIKTLEQAQGIAKLRGPAFVFLPQFFITAVFSMNVSSFSTSSRVHIWTWIAVSLPVLMVSLAIMLIDEDSEYIPRSLRRIFEKADQ